MEKQEWIKGAIITFLLCSWGILQAQENMRTIKGVVKDPAGKWVSEAFVLLSDTTAGSSVGYVAIEETDSIGRFVFSTAHHFNKLIVNRIGYTAAALAVEPADKELQITIQPDEQANLNEVVVRGVKKAVQLDARGLTYDMSQNPVDRGSTLDAMRFVPLIQVKYDAIMVVGKNDVKYYVDGKELKLSSDAIRSYIRSLPAESIEKVEVITSYNPPFVTEIDQGAVNFVLKKNKNEGVKGNVDLNVWKTHYMKGQGSVILSYNKKKLKANLFVNGNYLSTWNEKEIDTHYAQRGEQTLSNSTFDGKTAKGSSQLVVNYDFNKHSYLSGQAGVEYAKNTTDEFGRMQFLRQSGSIPYATIAHDNSDEKEEKRVSAGLTYQHNAVGKGGTFRASFDYYYGNVSSTVENKMDSLLYGTSVPHEHYQEIIPQKSNAFSTNLLYTKNLGEKGYISFELKNYLWKINNDDRYYRLKGLPNPELDQMRSQHLKVDEWTLNAALSWVYRWSKQIETNVGFSMNRRNYQSEQLYTAETYEQHYWQPSPFLTFNYSPSHLFGLTYDVSYRLQNPGFAQMNPFKWYSSATTYSVGNPTLKQMKQTSQSLMLQLLQKGMIRIGHTHVDDGIVQYNFVKEDGMIERRPENMQTSDSFGLYFGLNNLSYAGNRGNVGMGLNLSREWFRTHLDGIAAYRRRSDGLTVDVNHFVRLSQKWNLQMINTLNLNSKKKYGFTETPASFTFYSSIDKGLNNWRFSLYGFVNGAIFDSKIQLDSRIVYKNADLETITHHHGESWSVGFRVSYSFGNQRVKEAQDKQKAGRSLRGRLN